MRFALALGISADVLSVFDDQRQLSVFDNPHSQDEERWATLGRSALGTVCVISHTFRTKDGEECIRIFSARRATQTKRKCSIIPYRRWP